MDPRRWCVSNIVGCRRLIGGVTRTGGDFSCCASPPQRVRSRPWRTEATVSRLLVPGRMRRRAALRGGDHVAVAIAVVHERRRPDPSALRPAVCEEQQLVAEVADALATLRAEVID